MTTISTLKVLLMSGLLLFSFQHKPASIHDGNHPTSAYSSEVLDKWMAMQIRLMAGTPAIFNGPFVRIFSYSGLVAFQSVAPGIPRNSPYWFSAERLNNLQALTEISSDKKYHWPSSLNAALAFMNRMMFPSAAPSDKQAIDSLENVLKAGFKKEASASTLERSAQYGLQVAQRIFAWAETDGYLHASDAYTPPTGAGKWVPTPPNYAKPVTPHWGSLRTIVAGSTEGTQPPAPIPYSNDSSSAFYKEVKEVYDISQHLKPEQKKITLYWKEINPGITAPGHWLNILRQLLQKEKATLDKAAFTYALCGMALNDAWISSWKTRYQYNVLRPVTYIREVMKQKDWLSLVPTPPHPEYTSGFAAMAGAVCSALAYVFGNDYVFTDHTYDDVGLGPRTYYSFAALAKEAGDAKIFGGIHYRFSVNAGLQQGRAVAQNIVQLLLQPKVTNKGEPASRK